MEGKCSEKTPSPRGFRSPNQLKNVPPPPKQRFPLTEKTNTVNTNTVNTGEILSKESDYDEGEDGSLPSENEETVSFLNEDVLQQRTDTLEAELKNTQENLKQLLADSEAKKFCVENLAKDDKLFKFYTGFSYMQFQACFEFMVNR